jgi:flagellar hook-associated protein 3 FlgL
VVTEKYLRSVNNISVELDRLQNQTMTGKRFTKVSEDTPAAVKAFQIRKDIARVEGYKASVQHAQGMLSNAESSIMRMQDLLHDSREKIIQGLNGTQSSEEREIIATHLKELQNQMLQLLNGNSADVYYFGGNSVRQEPFSVAEDGSLQYRAKDGDEYRWIKLKDLSSISNPNDPGYDPKQYALYQELMSAGLFVDIGMGIRSEDGTTPVPAGTTGSGVDRNSVFTYTLPGIEITGVGTITSEITGKQVSANIYDLLGEIADSLSSKDYSYEETDEMFGMLFGGDKDQLPRAIRVSNEFLPDGSKNPDYDTSSPHYDATLNRADASFDQAKYDNLIKIYENVSAVHRPGTAQSVQFAITNVGTKQQFLEFVTDSLETRKLNDLKLQKDTESVDLEESVIYYDSQKIAYQAALAMGAQIIPMSIFNYMS